MAIENFSDFATIFPPELISRFEFLIIIFQAVGWFIIFYIIFNIINTIINRKKNMEIKKISKNLEEIKKLLTKKIAKK